MRKLALFCSLLVVPAALSAQQSQVGRVGWLVGCWERTGANSRAVEKWFAPRDGALYGTSQIIGSAGARETEQLRLYEANGVLVYDAHPSGQARTQFRAREVTPTSIVFVNPEHDFPQQITYTLAGDSLTARVEGDRGGRIQPQMFRFRRAECPEITLPAAFAARLALEPKYADAERREQATFAGRIDWFAETAAPGYSYVRWAAPGSVVAPQDAAALRQMAETLRNNWSAMPPRDRRYTVTVERVQVRGDTAEVLVTGNVGWRFTDAAGRLGPAGGEHEMGTVQRWLDTWVRAGEQWTLRMTRLLFEEATRDGKVTGRDGRPVSGGSP